MTKVINEYGCEVDYNESVLFMDEQIMGRLHMEIAPCTEQEFFDAYCKAHEEEHGEPWFLAEKDIVW